MAGRELDRLLRTSYFRVLIGDRELGVAEISPLTSTTDPERPDGEGHRFENVVLRRALTTSTELYDWRRRVVEGARDRRDVTIHQLESPDGPVANTWRLVDAWPWRWSGPSFNAATSEIALEELELVFADLVWVAPGEREGG